MLRAAHMRWLREYRSQSHSAAISQDESLLTVRKPPAWMFFFYDDV